MTSDPGRLFLLSLLDDFKKIPNERKADVKISMINSIRSASLVQLPAPPPPPPPPPRPPHQYRNNYTSHSVYATASSQPLRVDPINPQNVTISTASTSGQSANNPISETPCVPPHHPTQVHTVICTNLFLYSYKIRKLYWDLKKNLYCIVFLFLL